MNWSDFVSNVQKWARERDIYKYSTPDAQLLKALSEVGELADAYIKQDAEGIVDGIGDIAVCLVNYQAMLGGPTEGVSKQLSAWAVEPGQAIGHMAVSIGAYIGKDAEDNHKLLPYMRTGLAIFAHDMQVSLGHCLQVAWDAIKERRGRMIPGGAFVKDEPCAEHTELESLKKQLAELENQLEAIGAGGVTSGQKLRR